MTLASQGLWLSFPSPLAFTYPSPLAFSFPCFNSLIFHGHLGYLLCGRHCEQKHEKQLSQDLCLLLEELGKRDKGIVIEIQINNIIKQTSK